MEFQIKFGSFRLKDRFDWSYTDSNTPNNTPQQCGANETLMRTHLDTSKLENGIAQKQLHKVSENWRQLSDVQGY